MSTADNYSASPHVAVLAFPFGGHAGTLFTLTRALAAAAPGLTFSFFSTAASLATLPPAVAGNIQLCPVADGCPDPQVPDVVARVGMFLKAALANLREGIEAAVSASNGVKVSCVASDALLPMARCLAEEMGVPWVPLWTGGTAALLAHLYTDDLRLTVGVAEQDLSERAGELLHFIPGLSMIRVRDLPEGILSGDLASSFSVLLHHMAKELPRANVLVFNAFEGLDPDIDAHLKEKFRKPLALGPFNLLLPPEAEPNDPQGCLPWLDCQDHATVTYISFGTVMSPLPNELAELAEGLEVSGVPFLWSLKETMKPHLPLGFLERTKGRGLVVPWAPQVAVLRHEAVGVFVSHCGWSSVLECISSGVPMVCLPLLGDQMINARFVTHVWRIGVGFEDGSVTREATTTILKTMLREDEGKKMQERARELMAKTSRALELGGATKENFNTLVSIFSSC